MNLWHPGRPLAAALVLLAAPVEAANLTATLPDGTEIARLPVAEGEGWCVLWRHSVRGFEVADCYENRNGAMVLTDSHIPDFAAGLDHIPGRGRLTTHPTGGYLIEGIDEPVPGNAYVLRPGRAAVDHRIRTGEDEVSLSSAAPHARVTIALRED